MKRKPTKRRSVKKVQTIKISRVAPKIRVYNAAYPDNPIVGVLQSLHNEGKLALDMDERAWLADRIAERLAEQLNTTSYGAGFIRRMNNWLKGWLRADVV